MSAPAQATLRDALARGADPRALARAVVEGVAALHAAGAVHGALGPGSVRVAGGRVVVEAGPRGGPPWDADAIPYAAPEVLRGARPDRRADVFAAAALASALLAGELPPPDASAEGIRRALHGPRALPAGLAPRLARALARAMERRWWRRARTLGGVVRAMAEGLGEPARPSTGSGRAEESTIPLAPSVGPAQPARSRGATPSPTPTATPTPSERPSTTPRAARGASLGASGASASGPRSSPRPIRLPRSRPARAALAAAVLAALAAAALARPDLDRAVHDRLGANDVAGARALLDDAERDGLAGPRLHKLRGDVACARGAAAECVRRYRLALAADAALREDPTVRRNARRLLERAQGCDGRRAAADLAGELRDPELVPALRTARRSGGLLGFLCGNDAIDRALAVTGRR